MSIAWATVALLVLLLPGFVFLARLYSVERTARESSASPLAFLAGAIPTAFFIQVLLYLVFHHRIDLEAVLAVLQLQGAEQVHLDRLAIILRGSRGSIALYVLSSVLLGYFLGWLASVVVRSGRFPLFIRHGLVRDLLVMPGSARRLFIDESIGCVIRPLLRWPRLASLHKVRWLSAIASKKEVPLTRAYVVSNIAHEGRVLMYKGALKQYYFTEDGQIAYLVLADCSRGYLSLMDPKKPRTSMDEAEKIGFSVPKDDGPRDGARVLGDLMIHGSDVANVYFERSTTSFAGADPAAFIKEARQELEREVSGKHLPETPKPSDHSDPSN